MTLKVQSEKNQKYKRGQHPNSIKNLKPGYHNQDHTHNGYTLTSTLKDLLHKESEFISPHARPKDKLWREQIAREMLVKSAQGDVGMVKELLDRTEGKVGGEETPLVDNRTINIYIQGDKKNLERLLAGEKPDSDGI